MSAYEVFTPEAALQVSAGAVNKVKSLVEEEGNADLMLRVYVTGGGCSGFQYGFAFDETVAEDDSVIEKDGVRVLVDAMSFPYLAGTVVDYQDGLQGARFVVCHPYAATPCGCGVWFPI